VREAHVARVVRERSRGLAVGQRPVRLARDAAPRAEVDLVDRDRRAGRLELRARLAPRVVAPAVVEVPHDGARARRDLLPHGERVRLVDAVAAHAATDVVLVDGALGDPGTNPLPHARLAHRLEQLLPGAQPLKSPTTETSAAFGAKTPNAVPSRRRASRGASRASPTAGCASPGGRGRGRRASSRRRRPGGTSFFLRVLSRQRASVDVGSLANARWRHRHEARTAGGRPAGPRRRVAYGKRHAASRACAEHGIRDSPSVRNPADRSIIRAAWTAPLSSCATTCSRPTTRRPRTASCAAASASASWASSTGAAAGATPARCSTGSARHPRVRDDRRRPAALRGPPTSASSASRRRAAG
jgi:hypothetical protein